MNINDFAKVENYKNHELAWELTLLMKSYDKESEPMHENRLNGLKSGRLKPRPIETRALLEISGNMVESFKA